MSGDLARYNDEGDIEFLGRIDNQVKIRGLRIELGEIETALQQHEKISECCVLAREDVPGRKRLVAYVSKATDKAGEVSIGELRAWLKQTLPEYMVPVAWCFLESLPVTPNGKIDRRALPPPTDADVTSAALNTKAIDAPRTVTEVVIAGFWCEIMNLAAVSIHDNFFDLGGYSLSATQLIGKINDTYKIDFPLSDIFAGPTVAEISKNVEAMQRRSAAGGDGGGGGHGTKEVNFFQGWDPVTESQLAEDVTAELRPADLGREGFVEQHLNPKNVLLTGVTGFVGAFLLYELLARTDATVWCLVRAENELKARKRLRKNMEKYDLWDAAGEFDSSGSRVQVLVGALDKPLLGLSENEFEEMAGVVDSIYHVAAQINGVLPYGRLKAPNVGGTVELIRMACMRKPYPAALHHISTLSVFPPVAGLVARESDELEGELFQWQKSAKPNQSSSALLLSSPLLCAALTKLTYTLPLGFTYRPRRCEAPFRRLCSEQVGCREKSARGSRTRAPVHDFPSR